MSACRKCGGQVELIGTGWMQIAPPHCPKCMAESARENRRERFESHFAKSGIPPEIWTYDRAVGNTELLDWCVGHADGWIWLGGETRVGKTRALARAAIIDTWRREEWPSVRWVDSAEFFLRLSDRSPAARALAREALEAAKGVGLLVIDDFGMETLTDDTRAMLFSLIDHRFNRRLRTWFSSNASGDELLAHVGEGRWPQIRHRIAERGTIRTWDGERWTETTETVASGQEAYWWQDM
jgi:hypothetical protein